MSRQKGFSLIELLIVVAIILVIAAIAIPSLLRSRRAANEASAVASLRTLATAEATYLQNYPTVGFTCDLKELGPPPPGQQPSFAAAGIIDDVLASGKKTGYQLALTNCGNPPRATYASTAVPLVPGTTGIRAFCSDPSAVIWFAEDSTAATCETHKNVL